MTLFAGPTFAEPGSPRAPVADAVLVAFGGISAGVLVGLVPSDRAILILAAIPALVGVAACLWRPILLLHLVFWSSALGSVLREVERTSVGGTSLSISGLRWIGVAGLAILVSLVVWRRLGTPLSLVPLAAFVLWMGVRWLIGPTTVRGLKDVIFYAVPVVVAVFAASLARRASLASLGRWQVSAVLAALAPWLLFFGAFTLGLQRMTPDGPKGVIGSRPVASFALIGLCLALAFLRHAPGLRQRLLSVLAAAALMGLILFTASRAATATAALLVLIHRTSPRRLAMVVPRTLTAAALALVVLLSVPQLRERMFHRLPSSIAEAGQTFDSSGRDRMWQVTATAAAERPVIGWAPGEVRPLIAQSLDWKRPDPPAEYPPHNEFLQVFHDGGIVGLVLLLVGWAVLAARQVAIWRHAHGRRPRTVERACLAANLAIVAILANAVVDNTFHYFVVMAPAFALIGVAEGLRARLPATPEAATS